MSGNPLSKSETDKLVQKPLPGKSTAGGASSVNNLKGNPQLGNSSTSTQKLPKQNNAGKI